MVIADYEMPYVSGGEFTRMVRRGAEVPDSTVPIIIVSSHSEEYRIREALAAGIHEYVVKPFSPQKIVWHIVQALEGLPSELKAAC